MAQEPIPDDIAALSFEQALEELEAIVRTLEGGESPLDAAIGAYERGALLKRHCEAKLTEARGKVEKITAGPEGATGAEPADIS